MTPSVRAVLIAQRRSGSTMLCFALSNHPEVHCARGETLHRQNSWRWAFGGAATPWGSKVYVRILGLALSQWGYKACVAKVNWGPGTGEVWDWLATVENPPVRGIYLSRENLLRQAVSETIRVRTKTTSSPRVHSPGGRIFRLSIEPTELLKLMETIAAADATARQRLDSRSIPYISLTYADLIGREGREAFYLEPEACCTLCDWLEVERGNLKVWPKRRANPFPLAEMLENWPDVEAAVANSRWQPCLEDEAIWN